MFLAYEKAGYRTARVQAEPERWYCDFEADFVWDGWNYWGRFTRPAEKQFFEFNKGVALPGTSTKVDPRPRAGGLASRTRYVAPTAPSGHDTKMSAVVQRCVFLLRQDE